MIVALITILITSILATSALSIAVGIGSAYAIHENGLQHGFIPNEEFDGGEQESPIESIPPDEGVLVQEPVLPEAVPQQSSPLNGLGEPGERLLYQVGETHGTVLGSDTGKILGLQARDLGLEANHTNSYQQPNDHSICRVLQDFFGTITLGDRESFTSLSQCVPEVSQQQQSVYFQGFTDGYAAAFPLGYYSGYFLDEHRPGSVQSPTQ